MGDRIAVSRRDSPARRCIRCNAPYRGFEGELFLQFPEGIRNAGHRAEAGRRGRRALRLAVLARAGDPSPRPRCRPANTGSTKPASVDDVFGRLGRGDVFYFSFTVPEGSNMFDIAQLLDAEGIMSGQDFLKAAETLEGFPVSVHVPPVALHDTGRAVPDDDRAVPQGVEEADAAMPGGGYGQESSRSPR